MKAAYVILVLYGLAVLAALAGIVYLIFRRMRVKNKEDFERRES